MKRNKPTHFYDLGTSLDVVGNDTIVYINIYTSIN